MFAVALRLGLTSFGGPVAHIATFRDTYVDDRRWVDEGSFSELVAVTNLLPGPSSSQLGIAIGTLRAGKLGGLAAWVGFTLPSAVAMTALGLGIASAGVTGSGWIHALGLVAVAVVLSAVIAMQRTLAPDVVRLVIAAASATAALALGGVLGQTTTIVVAALLGVVLFRRTVIPLELHWRVPVGRGLALASLAGFVALLVGLPALRDATGSQAVALAASMFRAGSLVFGGGHVVLPLLDASVVGSGWVDGQDFLAGYGAAQAMPGPLFTFSAYLGAVSGPEPNGIAGASLALVSIFLPSFLLLAGVLPLWQTVRRHAMVQAAVTGVGAAVVGLLAAALWDPVITTSVETAWDVAFAALVFLALRFVPVWVVVPAAAVLGQALFS